MDQPGGTALSISYDEDADVLYVAFGEPQAGVDDEVEDGVYLRRSGDDGDVTGLTIVDFVRRFAHQPPLQVPVEVIAKAA